MTSSQLTHVLETELDLLRTIYSSKNTSKSEDRSYGHDRRIQNLFGDEFSQAPKFKTNEVVIDTVIYLIWIKIGYDQQASYSEPSFMFDKFQDWTMVKKATIMVQIQPTMKRYFQNSPDMIDPGIVFPKLNMRGRFNMIAGNNNGQTRRAALMSMEEIRAVINECVRKSKAFNVMM